MELIYIHIEKYRNYEKSEVNLSNKFNITYEQENKNIYIKKIESPNSCNLYPKHISNINAIVGMNSVGKSNLLDLIGMRKGDRNKQNEEFKSRFKNSKKGNLNILRSKDYLGTDKKSIYFFVYFYGKNEANEYLYVVEGNDIESYKELFKNYEQLMNTKKHPKDLYRKEKYWFPFICTYKDNKFYIEYSTDARLGNYEMDNELKIRGDYSSEQDKIAIITFRAKYNPKYYDSFSFKNQDESRIMIPRRIAMFKPRYVSSKINLLYAQLNNTKNLMYTDNNYVVKIKFFRYIESDNELIKLKSSYENVGNEYKGMCELLHNYLLYTFNSLYRKEDDKKDLCIKQVNNLKSKYTSIEDFLEFYHLVHKTIVSNYFPKDEIESNHLFNVYSKLVDVLVKNASLYKINEDVINIELTKDCSIKEILNIIKVILDEGIESEQNDLFTVFNNFFEYEIWNLSDGENAYLDLYSSIYEQVNLLANKKEKFIFLLDEPEVRMHPNLIRCFINDLITFLKSIDDTKIFQVIIATHSPFILSDIIKDNAILLNKTPNGICKPMKCEIDTFASNIHNLFKESFFMDSTMGEYAKNRINSVIRFLNNDLDESMTKQVAKNIIEVIGEQLIQNKLIKMYQNKYIDDIENTTIKIQNYQDKINYLQSIIKTGNIVNRNKVVSMQKEVEEILKNLKKLNQMNGEKND